jgi:hypothetical protein
VARFECESGPFYLYLGGTFLSDLNFGAFTESKSMSPGEHRRHAAECLRLAEDRSDPQERLVLIDMAQAWLQLAHQAEQNLAHGMPNDD